MSRSVVLIVDDVEATRTGLAQLLDLLGYATEEAKDGDEALRRLRANPRIAVVVLDLLMPGANGYWFREQQLNDPAIADTPVIVFTGSEMRGALREALRATDVLHKPVSADALCEVISRYCEPAR